MRNQGFLKYAYLAFLLSRYLNHRNNFYINLSATCVHVPCHDYAIHLKVNQIVSRHTLEGEERRISVIYCRFTDVSRFTVFLSF